MTDRTGVNGEYEIPSTHETRPYGGGGFGRRLRHRFHKRQGAGAVRFLSERKDDPGAFHVVGGPQGLFELSADGAVKPHGRSIDTVTTKYRDEEQKAFIKELKEAAGKWPGPRRCCD
jgi:hypothetical protein